LSVPVAGTALVIMDPYVTARSLSTPASIFAIACYLSNRRVQTLCWLVATALVHPQMCAYCIVLLGGFWLAECARKVPALEPAPTVAALALLPFWFDFHPATGVARDVLHSRTYFFGANWPWYEWAGAFVPLAIVWWSSSKPLSCATTAFQRLVRTLVPFGLLFTAIFVVLSSSPRFENFTRLQPMRAFHLIYVIFFSLLGAYLAEYILGSSKWRWAALLAPLAAGMFVMQLQQFPHSPHVEWPGSEYQNNWTAAFDWIRLHTPKDAVFALDPQYMAVAEDDQHGFRAIAERSALADAVKDSGAVSLFPQLAANWKSQVQSQEGWDRFTHEDFEHLATLYPVSWIVTRNPALSGLECPYQNTELAVCRITHTASTSNSTAVTDPAGKRQDAAIKASRGLNTSR
jgi:hypothetical protein